MTEQEIADMFYTDLTMQAVSKIAKCRQPKIKRVWISTYGNEAVTARKRAKYRASKLGDNNPMLGKQGKLHHRYRDRISDHNGYVRIHAPEWYTGPQSLNYVREHIAVYCATAGITELPTGMEVHHLDLNKQNNDPDNLIMLSKRDHALLHGHINRTSSAETIP